MIDKSKQGKKNRQSGQRFELKVRKELEGKGWVVDRWGNNVEDIGYYCEKCGTKSGYAAGIGEFCPNKKCENNDFGLVLKGKLIPAKSFMGRSRTTGFPDFIVYCKSDLPSSVITQKYLNVKEAKCNYVIIGVECKSNGYLDKKEKAKCKWLLENNIFSKILIASKGKKRGEIKYDEK